MPQDVKDILLDALKKANPGATDKNLSTALSDVVKTQVDAPTVAPAPKPTVRKEVAQPTPGSTVGSKTIPFNKSINPEFLPKSISASKPVVSNSFGTVGANNPSVVQFRKLQSEAEQRKTKLNTEKAILEDSIKKKKTFDGKPLTEKDLNDYNSRIGYVDNFNKAFELDFGRINIKGVDVEPSIKKFRQPSLSDLNQPIKTIDVSPKKLKGLEPDSEESKYASVIAERIQRTPDYAKKYFGDSYAKYQEELNKSINKSLSTKSAINPYSVIDYTTIHGSNGNKAKDFAVNLSKKIGADLQNFASGASELYDKLTGDYTDNYQDAIDLTGKKIKQAQKEAGKLENKLTDPTKYSNKEVEQYKDREKLKDLNEQINLSGTAKSGSLYGKIKNLKEEAYQKSLSTTSKAWLEAYSLAQVKEPKLDKLEFDNKVKSIREANDKANSILSSVQDTNIPNTYAYTDPTGKTQFINAKDKKDLSNKVFDIAFKTINSSVDPTKLTTAAELKAYARKFPNNPFVKQVIKEGKEKGVLQETVNDAFLYLLNAFIWSSRSKVLYGPLQDNPFEVYMASKTKKDSTNPLLQEVNLNDWSKDFLITSSLEGDRRTIASQAEDRLAKIDRLKGASIPMYQRLIDKTTDPTLKQKYIGLLATSKKQLVELEAQNIEEKKRDDTLLKSLDNRLGTEGKLSDEWIAAKQSQDANSFESLIAGSAQTTRDLIQFAAMGAAATVAAKATAGTIGMVAPSLAAGAGHIAEIFVVASNRHMESKMEMNDAVSSNYNKYLNRALALNGVGEKDLELMSLEQKESLFKEEELIEMRNRSRIGSESLYWKNMALAIPDLLQLRMLKGAFTKTVSNEIKDDFIKTFGKNFTVNLSQAKDSFVGAYFTGYLGEKGEEGAQFAFGKTQERQSEGYDVPTFGNSIRTLVGDIYNTATSMRLLPGVAASSLGGIYSDDDEFQYSAELGGFSGGVMGGVSAVGGLSKQAYGYTMAQTALTRLGIYDSEFVSDIISGEALKRSFEKGNSQYILDLLQNRKAFFLKNDPTYKKFNPNATKESLSNIDDPLLDQLKTIAADRAARGNSDLLKVVADLEEETKKKNLFTARTQEEAYDSFVKQYMLARDIYSQNISNIRRVTGFNIGGSYLARTYTEVEGAISKLTPEQQSVLKNDSKGLAHIFSRMKSVVAENAMSYSRGIQDLNYLDSLKGKLIDSEIAELRDLNPGLSKDVLEALYELESIPEIDLESAQLQALFQMDPTLKEKVSKNKEYYTKKKETILKKIKELKTNGTEETKTFLDSIFEEKDGAISLKKDALANLKTKDITSPFINETILKSFVEANLRNSSIEFANKQLKDLGKIKTRTQLLNWYNNNLSEAEKRLQQIRLDQLRSLNDKEKSGVALTEEEQQEKDDLLNKLELPEDADPNEIDDAVGISETEDSEGEVTSTIKIAANTLFNSFPSKPLNTKVNLSNYPLAKKIKGLKKLVANDIELDLIEVNNKDGYFTVMYGNQLFLVPIANGPLDASSTAIAKENPSAPELNLEFEITENTSEEEAPTEDPFDLQELEENPYKDFSKEELEQLKEELERDLERLSGQLEIESTLLEESDRSDWFNGIPQMQVLNNMEPMNTASVRKEVGKNLRVGIEIPLRWVSNKTKLTLQGLADKIWSEYFYDSNYDSTDIRDMILELLQIGRDNFVQKYGGDKNSVRILQDIINETEAKYKLVLSQLNEIAIDELLAPKPIAPTAPVSTDTKADIEIISENYTPELLRGNPDKLFLFGDNNTRTGKGGQAVIRDEPNAAGISTKLLPKNTPEAFMSDDQLDDNKAVIDSDIKNAKERATKEGKTIVLPKGGFGTGLAALATKAPETFAYLNKRLQEEFGFNNTTGELAALEEAPITPTPPTETKAEKKQRKEKVKGKLIFANSGFGKSTASQLVEGVIDADELLDQAIFEITGEVFTDPGEARKSLYKSYNGKHVDKKSAVEALFLNKIKDALAEGKTVVTANFMVSDAAKKGLIKVDVVIQAKSAKVIVERTKNRTSPLSEDAAEKQITHARNVPVPSTNRVTLDDGVYLADVLVEDGATLTPLEKIPTVKEEEPIVTGTSIVDNRRSVKVYEFNTVTTDDSPNVVDQSLKRKAFVSDPNRNTTHNMKVNTPAASLLDELRKIGFVPGMPSIPPGFLFNKTLNPKGLTQEQLQSLRNGKPILVKLNPNINNKISIVDKSGVEISNLQSPDSYYIVIPSKDFGQQENIDSSLLTVKKFDPTEYTYNQLKSLIKFDTTNNVATVGEVEQFVNSYKTNKAIFINLERILKPGSPVTISLSELDKYGIKLNITSGMVQFSSSKYPVTSYTEQLTNVVGNDQPIIVKVRKDGTVEVLNKEITMQQKQQILKVDLGKQMGYKLVIKHPVTGKMLYVPLQLPTASLARDEQATLLKNTIENLIQSVADNFDSNIGDFKYYNDQMKLFGADETAMLNIVSRNPKFKGLFFNLKVLEQNKKPVYDADGNLRFVLEIKKNGQFVAKIPVEEILSTELSTLDDIINKISEKVSGIKNERNSVIVDEVLEALKDTTATSVNQQKFDIDAIVNTAVTNVSPIEPFTPSQITVTLAENIISDMDVAGIEENPVSSLDIDGAQPVPGNNEFDTFYEQNSIDVDGILEDNEVSLEKIKDLATKQNRVFRTILEFKAFVKENAC